MNKFVIPSCLAILVLVLVLVVLLYAFKPNAFKLNAFKLNAFKPDYFTQSSKFESGNQMMLVDPDGSLVLQPVGDIDSSINAVGSGVETDAAKIYQLKADMAPYATTKSVDDKMAAEVVERKSDADTRQRWLADNYVQKNKWTKIINRDNPNHSVHRAQGYIQYDNNVEDDDARRWFKFVEQDP